MFPSQDVNKKSTWGGGLSNKRFLVVSRGLSVLFTGDIRANK